MNARVLVATNDGLVRGLLCTTLQQGGLEVEAVRHGPQALSRLTAVNPPRLALLDWHMPAMSGPEVCRAVRQSQQGTDAFMVLLSNQQRESAFAEGFEAGADDVAARPFDPPQLLARLQAAHRRLQKDDQGSQSLRRLLHEASRGGSGEVVVRSAERVGRVVFHAGRVVWVHLPREGSLRGYLEGMGLGETELKLAFEECRLRGLPLLDTLVDWGLVPMDELAVHIRTLLTERLTLLLEAASTTSFFVPGGAPFQSGFSYTLEELGVRALVAEQDVAPRHAAAGSVRPIDPSWFKILDEVRAIEGVRGVSVHDRASGVALLVQGEPCSHRLLRALMALMEAGEDDPVQSSWVVSESHLHVLRAVSETLAVSVRVDQRQNSNLGLLQFMLRRLLPGPREAMS